MDFRLTEDQLLLQSSIREYLEGTHGPELLRALDESETKRQADIWQGLVEMGLTGLLVPEAQGGLGMTLVEAALIAEELGRANVSEPLVDTAFVAAPLLAGDDARLAAIAAGELKVALAHPFNPWVADLDQAGLLIAGDRIVDAPSAGEKLDTIDPLRKLFAAPADVAANDRMLDLAALMASAQMLGAAQRMLDLAAEYAKAREQFGQPIGSFQAVKHHLSTAMVRIEFARPVVWRAAKALADGQANASTHVSHAKLATTDAAMLTAETAIQVHGAMGYTYEVDLHFWMKRVWALAGAWGDRAYHLRQIDKAVIGGGIAIGTDQTFAA